MMRPRLLVRCDEETHRQRSALLRAARRAHSIVATSPAPAGASSWMRGTDSVVFSSPAFRTVDSRHPDGSLTFQDLIGVSKGETRAAAIEKTQAVVSALEVLVRQSPDLSHGSAGDPLADLRAVLCMAASAAGFHAFDVTIQAANRARSATCAVYHDGPEPWLLAPRVEAGLLASIPHCVEAVYDEGLGVTTFAGVEVDDQPDEDPMTLLRATRRLGLRSEDLELRHSWPVPSTIPATETPRR